MVQLVCSPKVREKLERELMRHGVLVSEDGPWALVERGHDLPADTVAVVFDAIEYMDVVRLLVSGVRGGGVSGGGSVIGTMTGQSGGSFTIIAPREVRYLEAAADGIVACTAAGRFRVRETLQHYETTWAGIGFIRINKSQLANIMHVTEIVPWFNSRYVLRLADGEELEVSKTYARGLRAALKM